MKFNRIKIDKKITSEKGIAPIDISRLGNVIALVGKNGSGKTRILDILESHLLSNIKIGQFIENSIVELPDELQKPLRDLIPYYDYFIKSEQLEDLDEKRKADPKNKNILQQISLITSDREYQKHHANIIQIRILANLLTKLFPKLKVSHLRRIRHSEVQMLQAAIDESKSNDSLTFENLIESVSNTNTYDEFKSIHQTALKYLSKLPHELTFDFMDNMGDSTKYEIKSSHKRFISLKNLMKNFLNKDLTWERKAVEAKITVTGVNSTYEGIWKLDGRPFNYYEFSDGERMLFSYALLFFLLEQNPKLNIKESIILVDEPELHLHPNSEIDLILGIRNAIGEKGQLIFATHSINILSSLSYDEIFMVKKGEIKHPSRITIGESVSELMGIEERISKLSDFLNSIASWSFVNFMVECFSNPEVIESARPHDPQVEAFKKAIIDSAPDTSSILLDFGAGKGRLYEQVKTDESFVNRISYSALEPEFSFHENLKTLGIKEVFSSHEQLPSNHFDFIVLCNVLHEIPIHSWESAINSIIEALKSTGFLIIIEAKTLTKGEKIGNEGFILLDYKEIQTLFDLPDLPTSINIGSDKDLISCAVMGRNQLNGFKKENIMKTLKMLEKNTLDKIISLRENFDETQNKSTTIGRTSAFLSQLHINSRIAQIKLSEQKKV